MREKRDYFFYQAFINSYSQLFFSDNRIFAYLLLLSSFIDPYAGISGAVAVLSAILFSYWIGLDRSSIKYGVYSFNALMLGLVTGITYQIGWQFGIVLICASILSVLLCVLLHTIFHKYAIPVFSLPFLMALWLVMLSLRTFAPAELIARMYDIAGTGEMARWLEKLSLQINDSLPLFLAVYFKSIAAIFFQYNILSGILAAIGLIIYSRIAFSLSFIGFSIGYLFYLLMVGSFTPLLYSYIGFNFILTAITLGGYFVIPSGRSYALVVIATPIIAIFISAFANLLAPYQLPLYSLPFNVAIILFMALLNNRKHIKGLDLVTRQLYSPEKNLYYFHNRVERFKNDTYYHIHLPFFGEWYISQGFDGKHTHKEDWKYAWDFVVVDDMKQTFRLPGTDVSDYYCYNLPVLAPAAGTVWDVVDGINDNEVGDVDIRHNWGNTIILKHGDLLYSKLSHLKKGSMKVKPGDYVQRGELLATCGSSGRSPEPHIHFQLQSTPYIGSKTLLYPLAYYMTRQNNAYTFHAFEYPEEEQLVSRITLTPALTEAFTFIPGVTLRYEVTDHNGLQQTVAWEVCVDAWNQSYLYCRQTRSYAYFVNNGTLHYFTEFVGDRTALLYHFYLAANKILLGYYDQLSLTDKLPITGFYPGLSRIMQDFIAPFFIYLEAEYITRFTYVDDAISPKQITIQSTARVKMGSKLLRELFYELSVNKNKIDTFTAYTKQGKLSAVCID
jgi:urea transporter